MTEDSSESNGEDNSEDNNADKKHTKLNGHGKYSLHLLQ